VDKLKGASLAIYLGFLAIIWDVLPFSMSWRCYVGVHNVVEVSMVCFTVFLHMPLLLRPALPLLLRPAFVDQVVAVLILAGRRLTV
jgi:hypothetical protein